MLLVVGFKAAKDLDRVLQRRLVHVDLLEAPHQGTVLLEVVPVFLVRRAAHAAQAARGKGRLQQVGRIHRTAARRARADNGVDFVDEQDAARVRFKLCHHRLEALLEVAAIARAGQQRAHVEREDRGLCKDLRHVALDDALGQAFRDGRFADTGIADIERVVLGPPAQDLNRALDLGVAPDQRVDLAGTSLFVEVDAVVAQSVLGAPARLLLALVFWRVFLLGPLGWTLSRAARRLRDAVRDEVHRVKPGHVLQLQEVDRMAFALAEQRDQHIGAGHFVPARALDMDGGPLNHALEACCRLRITRPFGREARQILVKEFAEVLTELVEVHPAGAEHRRGVAVLRQAEQQMLKRGILMPAFAGEGQGAMQRLFKVA